MERFRAGPSFAGDLHRKSWKQVLVHGTASVMSDSIHMATNRLHTSASWAYDDNGNTTKMAILGGGSATMTYDIDNRMSTWAGPSGTESYGYLADNKRVWKKTPAGVETYYFYGVGGQKLATYSVVASPFSLGLVSDSVYFGGKMIRSDGVSIVRDRLGSVVARSGCGNCSAVTSKDYFPYGDEIGTATSGDVDKFGTYLRDQTTGLHYADQRFYSGTMAGRFLTVDPAGSGTNWYAYADGDPVNSHDPSGLAAIGNDCNPGQTRISPLEYEWCRVGTVAGGGNPLDPLRSTLDAASWDLQMSANTGQNIFLNTGNINLALPFVSGNPFAAIIISQAPTPVVTSSITYAGQTTPSADALSLSAAQILGSVGNTTGSLTTATPYAAFGAAATAAGATGVFVVPPVAAAAIGYTQGFLGAGVGIVIGKFPGYLNAAEAIGANAYSVSTATFAYFERFSYFGYSVPWIANRAFLQASIWRGQQIYLSAPAANATGYFASELDFLISKGLGPSVWQILPVPGKP